MQREAEERVREMQTRARLVGGEYSPPTKPAQRNFGQAPNFPKGNSGALPFGMDSDKMIILAVLWLLYNEKADSKLLLALLYLLL